MEVFREHPSLYIYDPGRKHIKGVMECDVYNMTSDLKFGTASEMEFSVNKYYYDDMEYCWKKNPYYDFILEHNIVCTSDTAPKYHFRNYEIDSCSISPNQTDRFANSEGTSTHPLSFDVVLDGCNLQSETLLFDIGSYSGYEWHTFSHIDDNGGIVEDTAYPHNIVCKEFIPVTCGDVLALGSRFADAPTLDDSDNQLKRDGEPVYKYRIAYYQSDDVSSFVKVEECVYFNPVGRLRFRESDCPFGTITGAPEEEPVKSGFIRIECYSDYIGYVGSGEFRYFVPGENVIRIYSGERRCSNYPTYVNGDNYTSERWWVIDAISEECESLNARKTVSLKSYDYTLSRKLFSVSEGICPLFVSDDLVNLVQSSSFIVDYADGTAYRMSQRMNRGIINQILDYLPEWSMGSIPGALTHKYRALSKVDNGNIFSFLIDTVQSTYNCFIVFDTENLKIHILQASDIFSYGSDSVLGWHNMLKSLTVDNEDSKYVTSLKAIFSDSTYGLGIVNPQGNNSVYNFEHIKNELNLVVDPNHKNDSGVPYTLKNRVEVYQQRIDGLFNGTYPESKFNINGTLYTYTKLCERFVNVTQECVSQGTTVHDKLLSYQQVADRINVFLGTREGSTFTGIPDAPMSLNDLNSFNTAEKRKNKFYSVQLYFKLLSSAEAYWGAQEKYGLILKEKRLIKKQLQWVARRLSVSPRIIADAIRRGESPVFTVKEAEYLSNYIIEGEWKNDYVSFSEQYDSKDIIDTLEDAYKNLVDDLSRYCRPIYNYEVQTSNIFEDPELSQAVEDIFLGNYVNIDNNGNWIKPVLLGVHIDYDNKDNGSLSLSTDYKRKPLEIRFSDMFATIQQTSVVTPEYTFDS